MRQFCYVNLRKNPKNYRKGKTIGMCYLSNFVNGSSIIIIKTIKFTQTKILQLSSL